MTHCVTPVGNDSPLIESNDERCCAFLLKDGTRTAKEIENSLKNTLLNSSTLQPIRDYVESSCSEDSTVAKVEITLPTSNFEEQNLHCDDYEYSTIFRNLSAGWLTFEFNTFEEGSLNSMKCYPIPDRRPQKSKIIFYHKIHKSASLPENSRFSFTNTEILIEHKRFKTQNIFKSKSKQIGIVVIVTVCGECEIHLNLTLLWLQIFLKKTSINFSCFLSFDATFVYPCSSSRLFL